MDTISETLGAATAVQLPTRAEDAVSFEDKIKEFRENAAANAAADFTDSRVNMKEIISTGMAMLDSVARVVEDTQSEKAITAAAQFMKTLADINESLVRMNNDVTKVSTAKAQPQQHTDQPSTQIMIMGNSTDIFAQARKLNNTIDE